MKCFYTLLGLCFTTVLFGMSPQQYRDCLASGEIRLADVAPRNEQELEHIILIVLEIEPEIDNQDYAEPKHDLHEQREAEGFPECALTDHHEIRRQNELPSDTGYQPRTNVRSSRSSIPHPDLITGFIDKYSMIFPFVSPPDMDKDSQIKRYKNEIERHNVGVLTHEMQAVQRGLSNLSFIDRYNRFVLSRRLSFLIRSLSTGQNTALIYLFAIYNATSLEDALDDTKDFLHLLEIRDTLRIDGNDIELDDIKRAKLMQIARSIIEHRRDYRKERERYPIASIGGELLPISPILTKFDLLFAQVPSFRGASTISSEKIKEEDLFANILRRTVKINPQIDLQVISGLRNLQLNDSSFKQYLEATIDKLKEMEAQGLLAPTTVTSLDVLKHGTKHYFVSLIPTNPLENPKEFSINLIKYTALGAIHTATGGVLLPIQVAAEVALKLHAIQSADTANMTPKQYAEFIAEELADITYQVAVNKLIQAASDRGIPQGFVKMTREMLKGDPEVSFAGDEFASASAAQPEGPTTQAFAKKTGGSGGDGGGASSARSGSAPKITTQEATKMAEKLGFKKTSYITSRRQRVFQKGNKFISIDVDNHSGGVWKMADSVKKLESKSSRLGTYDEFLNRIGD